MLFQAQVALVLVFFAAHVVAIAGALNNSQLRLRIGDCRAVNWDVAHLACADVPNWDTSQVTDMSELFLNAGSGLPIDISRWDTGSVITMRRMFRSVRYWNGDISRWNTSSVTDMSEMFELSHFNGNISSWDTSSVTNMYSMFYFADRFNNDLSQWDTSSVTDMSYMFSGSEHFDRDLSRWNTSSVTDMQGMFCYAYDFRGDISTWNTGKVTAMQWMFYEAYSFAGNIGGWDVSNVENMAEMFFYCCYADGSGDYALEPFDTDFSAWNTARVTDMYGVFDSCYFFNGSVAGWDVSRVTDMTYMFYDAVVYNDDLSRWDTSAVESMESMFFYALSFNGDISTWNTSAVTSMRDMFDSAEKFNSDISRWDTSSVTDMTEMFNNAILFNVDLCAWSRSNAVVTDAFRNSPKLSFCDVNECVAGICDGNATCTNTAGSFTCLCNEGFSSVDGGVTCFSPSTERTLSDAADFASICQPGFELFEYVILASASYSATQAATFRGDQIVTRGSFIGIQARYISGFISCDRGVSTSTEFAWQACNVGPAFELQINGSYVFAQPNWYTAAPGCFKPDTPGFVNPPVSCTRPVAIGTGDEVTLGWYESTRGVWLADNAGTITVDLVGFTCERDDYVKPPSVSCRETDAVKCDATAFCEDYQGSVGAVCECPEGSVGDGVAKQLGGSACSDESWAVVVNLDLGARGDLAQLTSSGSRLQHWEIDRAYFSDLLFRNATAEKPTWFDRAMHHTVTDGRFLTIHALFESKAEADRAVGVLNNNTLAATFPIPFSTGTSVLTAVPRVQDFAMPTSHSEIQVLPTGMEVTTVHFRHDCMSAGCWVIDLLYTTGEDSVNVFYIPKAIGNDTLSFDFDYASIPDYATPYSKSPADTFLPLNFPCGSDTYQYKPGPHIPDRVSACCIEEFAALYRPVETFVTDTKVAEVLGDSRDDFCAGPTWCAPEGGVCNCTGRVQYGADGQFFYQESDGQVACSNDVFGDPIANVSKACSCSPARKIWTKGDAPMSALQGNFSGMDGLARVDFKTLQDPFILQYTASVYLDEVALRRKAGVLTGAVGVAHAIDTFIGFANFKPTGLDFLDMFAAQTNIHLEKTNFFTVSAYGENQYTFLEYINLRLVAIYKQDDGSASSASGSDFSRTNNSDAAHYLQVTFTLGAQYQPIETGIIPIDSVLVSKGDFISSAATLDSRFHPCSQYLDGSLPQQALFDSRFPTETTQTCAPNATMCYNPPHVPDQFVSFNVPLGIDWLPSASNAFDSNVFVDMVVSVVDTYQIAVPGGSPNLGHAAEQMKTTLTASIPVVDGGVYIFCDKITVKDDLLDIANADLILGSAGYEHEFSRLRILKDIASGPFDTNRRNETFFDTDSIEAGLMTLVIKGNESYFSRATGFSLEVEDVITIHVMEPETGTKYSRLLELLFTPGREVQTTEGFPLNGAFTFTLDPARSRVMLEPTTELQQLCPSTPQRPNPNDLFPETCVSRRDVRHRGFPALAGKNATAIELPAATVAVDDAERDAVARFMQTVLNPSEYSAQLGRNFSYIVAQQYELNGRYNRAFWINPGYEWTPRQIGRRESFTLSQKLVMFALINLDEGFTRRRMLLQSTNPIKDTGAGVSGQQMTFATSPQSMMASLYSIPEDLVATFDVQLQLTQQQLCFSEAEQRLSIRAALDEYVAATATQYETVQVLSVLVDGADVQCSSKRSLTRKLLEYSAATATVEMMVVFTPAAHVAIDLQALASLPGIISVAPVSLSDAILIVDKEGHAAPPAIAYTPSPPSTSPVGEDGGAAPAEAPPAQAPTPETVEQPSSSSAAVTVPALVAGLGVAGVAGAWLGYKKYQLSREQETEVIQSLSVTDVKSDLVLPEDSV